MIQDFEYKGQWFLPSNPNQRHTGVLSYNFNEGSTLELFGSLEEFDILPSAKDVDVILGITSDSKKITLYRCYVSKAGGKTLMMNEESGIPSTTYTVNFIFEGVHLPTKEDIKFDVITSEINNLDEWVGISGFLQRNNVSEEIKNREINLKYKLPETIKFTLNDKLEAQFNFVINRPGWSRFEKSISLNQKLQFVLSSKEELSIEDLLKYVFTFQNFLIIALYQKTFPNSITLTSRRITKDYGNGPVRTHIKLYFTISNRSTSVKRLSDIDVLFAYGHIKEEFPMLIYNWYAKYELLEPAFNLLFEHFYNSERFTENTFLNLAQAAETFHSRTNNRKRIPKPDFAEMKDVILKIVPDKYHEWLKDQFSFGNNLNLHTRLTEIVSKTSNEILDKIIGDKELFITQVKHSRNYYTHYSQSGEKNALKGVKLFYLTEKLKILLVCAFLVEIGFDKEKLEKLLERNKYRFFNHLVVQW